MPFTPYHFGPGLLLGVLFFPFVDLVAVLTGAVVLDIEPLVVLMFGLSAPLHGLAHTYVFAVLVSVALAAVLWTVRRPLLVITSPFGVTQEPTKSSLLLGSLMGTFSHVLLDSFLYAEMNPFFPVLGNPFLGLLTQVVVYDLCVYSLLIGFGLYVLRFWVMRDYRSKGEEEDVFGAA
jgi:membrane-bound metal-dependent hydrolase YbcI (DUF457 family)